jgi:hypothetical protein
MGPDCDRRNGALFFTGTSSSLRGAEELTASHLHRALVNNYSFTGKHSAARWFFQSFPDDQAKTGLSSIHTG